MRILLSLTPDIVWFALTQPPHPELCRTPAVVLLPTPDTPSMKKIASDAPLVAYQHRPHGDGQHGGLGSTAQATTQGSPPRGQELSIVYKSPGYEETTLRLPLEENASVSCLDGEGTLRVEPVEKLEGGLEVTLRLDSELRLQYAGVQLLDNQGIPAKSGPFVRYGRRGFDNTVSVPFVTDLVIMNEAGPHSR